MTIVITANNQQNNKNNERKTLKNNHVFWEQVVCVKIDESIK